MDDYYWNEDEVSDEWIAETLKIWRTNPLQQADVRLLIKALEELQERRFADLELENSVGIP